MSRFHLVSWLKASLFPFSRLTSCLWKLALRRKKLVKAVNIGFHLWISVGASTERKSSLGLFSLYGIRTSPNWFGAKLGQDQRDFFESVHWCGIRCTWNIYVARVSTNLIFVFLGLFWISSEKGECPFFEAFLSILCFCRNVARTCATAEGFLLGPWSQSFESRKVCLKFGGLRRR